RIPFRSKRPSGRLARRMREQNQKLPARKSSTPRHKPLQAIVISSASSPPVGTRGKFHARERACFTRYPVEFFGKLSALGRAAIIRTPHPAYRGQPNPSPPGHETRGSLLLSATALVKIIGHTYPLLDHRAEFPKECRNLRVGE